MRVFFDTNVYAAEALLGETADCSLKELYALPGE
jgi:hypothetical protein